MTALTQERMRRAVENARPTDYVTELLLLPKRIEEAELSCAEADWRVDTLKHALEDEEARLIVDGVVSGSNAETRKAGLKLATAALRLELAHAERLLEERRIQLRYQQNRFSAMRAIVRYLAREGDEG